MTTEKQPGASFADVLKTGIQTFQTMVEGVTAVLRTGDSTIRELDDALTGRASDMPAAPDEAFLQVIAVMQAAMLEAREKGSASSPQVVQKAREMLGKINRQEPAWRPGPAAIRTVNDAFRVALRDLRASKNLLNLAQGNGSIDDLEALTKWADDFSQRMNFTQQIIQQPKPSAVGANPVPEAAAEAAASSPVMTPVVTAAAAEAAQAEPAKPKKRKRNTTPKAKPNPDDVAFAKAVAEEMGDVKVKEWAEQYEQGKISEKQWISRLTNHAAAARDSLDDVFARATERMARNAAG